MTLPVQPPGGYHGGASSRGFPHKRLPYGGGGSFLKKHPHMPSTATGSAAGGAASAGGASASAGGQGGGQQQHAPAKPSNAAAQASAVAAATTAVAAAKAAAQSAANATTNPGILAQVSKQPHIKQEEASEDSTGTPELMTSSNGGDSATEHSSSALDSSLRLLKQESKPNGELSEISDSDDDILNKTDKVKPKCELQLDGALAGTQEVSTDALSTSEEAIKCEPQTRASSSSPTASPTAVAAAQTGAGGEAAGAVAGASAMSQSGGLKVEGVDEVLDFEEISDGELEEDARHKGKSNKRKWTANVPTD